MLRADVVVAELESLAERQLEGLFGLWAEGDFVEPAGIGHRRDGFDEALSYDGVAHARLVQGRRRHPLPSGQAEQEVLGSDERVLEGASLLLGL